MNLIQREATGQMQLPIIKLARNECFSKLLSMHPRLTSDFSLFQGSLFAMLWWMDLESRSNDLSADYFEAVLF